MVRRPGWTTAAHQSTMRGRNSDPQHVRGWDHFSQGPGDLQAAFAAAQLADRLRSIDPGQSATL